VLVVVALWAGLSFGGAPAQAALPGDNGRLVCEGQRGDPAPGVSRTEVFSINPDGTEETVLTDNLVRDGDPSFSPDGRNIAFESYRGEDGFSEAYRMAADGSDVKQLTTSGDNEDRSTNWSPDGSRITFHSDRDPVAGDVHSFDIYTMNADGSDQRRITNHPVQDSLPAWSPDGTKIAFLSLRDGNFEIYKMNVDGSDVQRLTRIAAGRLPPDLVS
jgi:Tol biopolymer transport system component